MIDRWDRIGARLRHPLGLAGAVLIVWLAVDAALYRSGAYYVHLAQPRSNTGAVVTALQLLEREYRPGTRTVLLFGDSRVAEGFSSEIAEAGRELRFINLAVAGSMPRTWYYILREVHRRGYRYDAVVVGTLYRPQAAMPLADWPLDPNLTASLLGWRDAIAFPATFASAAMRARARRAVLFPALAMQQDTRALLADPGARWRSVREDRPRLLSSLPHYRGREARWPALAFDGEGHVVDWTGVDPPTRQSIEQHLADLAVPIPPAVQAENDRYLRRWLRALALLSAAQGAPIVFFPLPRGPYADVLPDDPAITPAEDEAAGIAHATALAPALVRGLERPEYFFDSLHVNRAGREQLTAVVGERVHAIVSRSAGF